MGIYFRDILLIIISRGANNCGQHSLEKNIYFIMRFSPHFQLFYFNDRLEFCEFIEWKIKRINNADLFSHLFIFMMFLWGFLSSVGLHNNNTEYHMLKSTGSDLDRSHLTDTRSAENYWIGADTNPQYRIDAPPPYSKTAHFRVAFYCGQPKAHLCNNHAV